MKIKTQDLIGVALDWAVAKTLGYTVSVYTYEDWTANMTPLEQELVKQTDAIQRNFKPKPAFVGEDGTKHLSSMKFYAAHGSGCGTMQFSSSWSQAGGIIEREEIGLKRNAPCSNGRQWEASPSITAKGAGRKYGYGPTPLIAAMRCYVASKLGDEVDIPEELV
jgi:hypothetical protein